MIFTLSGLIVGGVVCPGGTSSLEVVYEKVGLVPGPNGFVTVRVVEVGPVTTLMPLPGLTVTDPALALGRTLVIVTDPRF